MSLINEQNSKSLPDYMIKGFFLSSSYWYHSIFTLRKIPQFHLNSWCGNYVKRHSFCIVSGDWSETTQKLCLSTKFSHQEIRWNYGNLRSGVTVYCLSQIRWVQYTRLISSRVLISSNRWDQCMCSLKCWIYLL